jgi:POT family proton-dependent oligopeptide transporter
LWADAHLVGQFYGSSVVFVSRLPLLLGNLIPPQTNFIQQPLPLGSHTGAGFTKGVSGALGMGQRASTGLTTFYQFWVYSILAPASFHSHCDDYQCYVTPLLGAYIADTYWGRYNTTCVAVVIALIGHIILIVAGALHV